MPLQHQAVEHPLLPIERIGNTRYLLLGDDVRRNFSLDLAKPLVVRLLELIERAQKILERIFQVERVFPGSLHFGSRLQLHLHVVLQSVLISRAVRPRPRPLPPWREGEDAERGPLTLRKQKGPLPTSAPLLSSVALS